MYNFFFIILILIFTLNFKWSSSLNFVTKELILQKFLKNWKLNDKTEKFRDASLNFVHDYKSLIFPPELVQYSTRPLTILALKSQNEDEKIKKRWNKPKTKINLLKFSSPSFLNLITISKSSLNFLQQLNTELRLNFQKEHAYNILWDRDAASEQVKSLVESIELKNWLNKIELTPFDDCSKIDDPCSYIMTSICHYCQNGQHSATISKFIERPSIQELYPIRTKSNFNFHGSQLRVGKGLGLPVVMRHRSVNGTIIPIGGFQVPMVWALASKMNFTVKFSAHTFGTLLSNKTYTGLVGKLIKEELDMVVAGVGIANRYSLIHYCTISSIHYIGFVSRAPRALLKWTAIFKAFSWNTWLALILIGFIVIHPFYIFLQIFGAFRRRRRKKRSDKKLRKLIYPGFLFLSRPLVEQQMTISITPTEFPGRLYTFFWFLSAILLSLSYKSELTSMMVHPSIDMMPQSFEELANSNYEIYMNFVGGGFQATVMATTSPAFVKIKKKMKVERNLPKCVKFSIENEKTVCVQGRISVIVEGNLNFTDRYGRSSFKASAAQAFPFLLSMLCPKDSVYAPALDNLILHYVDSGLIQHAIGEEPRLTRKIGMAWAKLRKIGGQGVNEEEEETWGILQGKHLLGTLILLVIGTLTSIFGFCLEQIFARRRSVGKRNSMGFKLYKNINGGFGFYPPPQSTLITQVKEASVDAEEDEEFKRI